MDFAIEEDTYNAAIKCADTLSLISAERIYLELTKTLLGQNLSILESFINDGGLRFLDIEKGENFNLISRLPTILSLRLFAFQKLCRLKECHLNSKLKFSNNLCRELEFLHILDKELSSPDKPLIKRLLAKTSPDMISNYLEYINIFGNDDISVYKEKLDEIQTNNEPYLISHLAIKGDDLLKLGYKGAEIGAVLNKILELVTENPTINNHSDILKIIKTI